MAGNTYHIVLYDSNAKLIVEQTFTGATTIGTDNLAQGVYFYTILTAGKVLLEGKIIK
jgi:hypothetical protein